MSATDPLQTYLEEARELLAELEESLLELEADPQAGQIIARAFRALHTIKGSGGMFGFTEIVRFTHDLETAFDRVRSGELPLTPPLLSLTLQAKDHLQALLRADPGGGELAADSDRLLAELAGILQAEAPSASSVAPPAASSAASSAASAVTGSAPVASASPETAAYVAASWEILWIRYRPEPNTFLTGCDPLALMQELAELGQHAFVYHDGGASLSEDYDPEQPYGYWDVVLNTDRGQDAVRDVFVFVDDGHCVRMEKVGDHRTREGDLELLAGIARDNAANPGHIPQAMRSFLQEKLAMRQPAKAAAVAAPPQSTSIRVDSDRLDRLVNMVGEMVIIQSRLSQAVNQTLDRAFLAQIAEDLERLTDEMRDNALGLRMLPIGTVYGNLRRLVRDVGISLGKDVDFQAEGGDTELDKTVIDRLKDPLIHILRNSMDHGIESREERELAGKPPQGTVRLWAGHAGGEVVIRVSDDGRGLDPEKIKRKAQAKGLLAPDAEPDRREILHLIFEPGFSTADKVSDLSGRGVGMDVVKRSIDALRGTVEVESELGHGVTLTLRLPLTLAIIDGFCVGIGTGTYIVPLTALRGFQERSVDASTKTVDVVERMGKMLPCVSLRRLFNIKEPMPEYERVVVAEVDGSEIGLAVDRVVGRQQAVIKSLDEMYKHVTFVSGTTINGDGSISLILDIPRLLDLAVSRAEAVQ
ncbi:chemotaxis protein CheA [Megalodesulfovibrio gigas]|uniref:Chemotaxis protein CheA n=1 Tax=Megalodesulfovibrio gigas (strain ATCC 19364 / DSM 1382 / NCIMB 9332 / VKM B-1759) TaxID=1121448 RepID=T2GF88_MEGG1|nr:chemotaxis protein CheA [Megalodesulfovibrio gigas]AGW14796.1 putative CheA signal transduction histidine kinase [Megalodesulfovibrio gigas DSM 1382 = ATCC 19364]